MFNLDVFPNRVFITNTHTKVKSEIPRSMLHRFSQAKVEFHHVTLRNILNYLSEASEFWVFATTQPDIDHLLPHKNDLKAVTNFKSIFLRKFLTSDKINDDESIYSEYYRITGLTKSESDEWIDIDNAEPHKPNSEYAIDFTPIEELLDLEIKVSPNVTLLESDGKKEWFKELGENKPTLIEIINSLIYELTFYGTEENKKKIIKDIGKIIDEED